MDSQGHRPSVQEMGVPKTMKQAHWIFMASKDLQGEKNKVKDVLDISKESISENKTEVSKVEIKNKKVNNEKSSQIRMIIIYLIIITMRQNF